MDQHRFSVALAGLAVVMLVAGVLAFATTSPARVVSTTGNASHEFVVECTWSHRAADDPIVHPGHAGAAHMHDFFGSVATDASSTATALLGTDSTCQTNAADTAAYWTPTLYDGADPVEPGRLFAYYRLPTIAGLDPRDLRPYPLGLAMVAGASVFGGSVVGDGAATAPQSTTVVGWHCGASPDLSVTPVSCGRDAPLSLRVRFPSCWDGEHLDSADHRSHVAYATPDACPSTHPVVLPELTMDVSYDFVGDPSRLQLASGGVLTGHADFLNAWAPAGLDTLVTQCLGHGEHCGIAPVRAESEVAER